MVSDSLSNDAAIVVESLHSVYPVEDDAYDEAKLSDASMIIELC